jgi:poly-beta-1,6-N-acetyl-D-glucosamine biosynthesis protein PgaD
MKAPVYSRAGVRHLTEITITAFFWAAWLYLIMPLLSLLLWLAGIHFFVEEMIVRGGYEALLGELLHYGLVVLGMCAVIGLWVGWNRQHYGGHNLRVRQPAPVRPEELAEYVSVSEEVLHAVQDARTLRVTFDERDHLVLCETIRNDNETGPRTPGP